MLVEKSGTIFQLPNMGNFSSELPLKDNTPVVPLLEQSVIRHIVVNVQETNLTFITYTDYNGTPKCGYFWDLHRKNVLIREVS